MKLFLCNLYRFWQWAVNGGSLKWWLSVQDSECPTVAVVYFCSFSTHFFLPKVHAEHCSVSIWSIFLAYFINNPSCLYVMLSGYRYLILILVHWGSHLGQRAKAMASLGHRLEWRLTSRAIYWLLTGGTHEYRSVDYFVDVRVHLVMREFHVFFV